ncbi:hypothetical protein CB1_001907088 [Camelus ferus]|nr:hypothetical protein CB1_001907088 [Camelus ferus]
MVVLGTEQRSCLQGEILLLLALPHAATSTEASFQPFRNQAESIAGSSSRGSTPRSWSSPTHEAKPSNGSEDTALGHLMWEPFSFLWFFPESLSFPGFSGTALTGFSFFLSDQLFPLASVSAFQLPPGISTWVPCPHTKLTRTK